MRKFLAPIALLALFCACEKKGPVKPDEPEDTGKYITATVNLPNSEVKTAWQEGDQFYAIQKTGTDSTVVTFKIATGAGTTSATFKAETEATEETVWTAVLGNYASLEGKDIICSFKGQKGTLEDVANFNYVKASGTGVTPTFDFNNGKKLSYVLKVKVPAGIKCVEYTPNAFWIVTAPKDSLQYFTPTDEKNADAEKNDEYAFAAFEAANTSTITLDNSTAKGDVVYIAVPPLNYSYNAGGAHISKIQWQNLDNGVIVTLMNDTSKDANASCGFVVDADVSAKGGAVETYDFSDKTLLPRPKPSDAIHSQTIGKEYTTGGRTWKYNADTYWAPFNLGGAKESDFGNYYAWGEVEPKTEYTEASALHRHSTDEANFYLDILSMKERPYANVGETETPAQYTIRGSRYDAARVQWGVAWRMASSYEVWAMDVDDFKKEATSISGTNGVKVTFKDGYIFLPITNIMEGTATRHYPNKSVDWATFWTGEQMNRVPGSDNNYQPWMFGHQSNIDWWNNKNYVRFWWGLPIRAVLASSKIEPAS